MRAPSASNFVSPVTHGRLSEGAGHWICDASGVKFPIVDGIPWLTPDPQRAIADWQNRGDALIQHLEEQVAIWKVELQATDLGDLSKRRMKKHRTLLIQHLEFLRDLLSPLKLKGKINSPQATALGYRLPASQGLLGYFQNLIRDWSLQTGENEAQLRAVETCLQDVTSLGRMAVLGSGGSRLAYDLHQSDRGAETIAIDLNPVLFLSARRILAGDSLSLVEFPIAPKSLEATAALRQCRVPSPPREGFHLVFGDCYHLPLPSGSLDTVLTPWLVDILPRPLEVLAQEINRALRSGGIWLNTGSLNFELREKSKCYSLEETQAKIEELGFQVEKLEQTDLPYLNSDLSGHHRIETVTSFRARKVADAQASAPLDPRPEWLRKTKTPIPVQQILQASRLIFEVQAYVLSLVDGQRSIDEIAELIAQKYGMPSENAREAVANFFARNYEDTIFER